MDFKKIKNSKGYTLIELLIYVSIFSIVSFGIVSYLASTINAKIAIDTQNDFIKQSRIAFDTIFKEIRESYDYEIVDEGTKIILYKNSDSTITNEIFLSDDKIFISRNGLEANALTQSTAKVKDLIFEDYTSTRSDDLIHIKLQLTNLDSVQNKYAQNEFRISTSINVRNVAD